MGTKEKELRMCSVQGVSNSCPVQRAIRKAHLALSHGYAGAVPEALLGLHLLVVIVPAGAQGSAQLILVLCQSLHEQQCRAMYSSCPGSTHKVCRWQAERGRVEVYTLMTTAVTDLSIQK